MHVLTTIDTILIILGIISLLELAVYITHLQMNNNKQGYLTIKGFKEKFDKAEWNDFSGGYMFNFHFLGLLRGNSMWNYSKGNKLHASIVQFDDKKYGLYYPTLIYATWCTRQYYKNNVACTKDKVTKTNVTMLDDILRRIKERGRK